jgi:hypothetical protein
MTNRSILVVEDIDCTIKLKQREEQMKTRNIPSPFLQKKRRQKTRYLWSHNTSEYIGEPLPLLESIAFLPVQADHNLAVVGTGNIIRAAQFY